MNKKFNWIKILYIISIAILIIGSIDPLEGSILIAISSIFLSTIAILTKDPSKKYYHLSSFMILFGIFFMFYFSFLGGFGEGSNLSWWWAILIIPYPIGWIITIILIIDKARKRFKRAVDLSNKNN